MHRSRFALCLLVGLTGVCAPLLRAQAQIAIGISITEAPPVLPVYVQPPIPAPDYLWTPGYWAYGSDGYFWVPGTWVQPPSSGVLWTPGYWAWGGNAYAWHPGYWASHVGYYGGVNYGFGYEGAGYEGGYWNNNHFFYNRSVNNIHDERITNVYNKTVIYNVTRVSYNGGHGGLDRRPTPQELAYSREHHDAPTRMQLEHEHMANGNHALRASENHGQPPIGATPRAAEFSDHPGDAKDRADVPEHQPGEDHPRPAQHDAARKTAEHPGYNPKDGSPPIAGNGEAHMPENADHMKRDKALRPAEASAHAKAHGDEFQAKDHAKDEAHFDAHSKAHSEAHSEPHPSGDDKQHHKQPG